MAVQQGRANGQKVGVTRVVNLDNTPWVLASADFAATDLDNVLGADNSERHQTTELGVLLDGVLVILLNVVGEVVDGDAVVLNVLHDQLLRLGKLGGGQRVGAANDGNNVDTGGKALHELNVELAEAVASGGDKVEESVNTIVSEARVTLDAGLLSQNIIVLSLQVANDLGEAVEDDVLADFMCIWGGRPALVGMVYLADVPGLVVNLVAEAGSVDDGQGDAGALLIQLELCEVFY